MAAATGAPAMTPLPVTSLSMGVLAVAIVLLLARAVA
jgi:hypothetical protein